MVSASALVVGVSDAADRWLDIGLGQPLGVLDRDILAAAIRVIDEPVASDWPAIVERLFERIEDEADAALSLTVVRKGLPRVASSRQFRAPAPARPPTHDPSGIGIDDEGQ